MNKDLQIDGIWDLGTYYGSDSICLNFGYKGKNYHRHDYGGILPKWIRVIWYVMQIKREIKKHNNATT